MMVEQEKQSVSMQSEEKESDIKHKYAVRFWRWFFFGIFFSFLPVIISVWVNWYIGYQTEFSEVLLGYFIDLVLVIFAVATNACSYATDGLIRIGWMIVAIGGMVISGIMYIIYLAIPAEAALEKLLPTFLGACVVLGVCSSVGFFIEGKNRKEELKCRGLETPTDQELM